MRLLAIVALLLSLAPAAAADILLLEGGGRIEGVVEEGLEHLVVRGIHGEVVVPKKKVLRRIRARYVTEVYEDMRGQADSADPEAQFRLALWCERNGLGKRARSHFQATVSLDPDHEKARAKLGFVRYRGIWMTPGEAKETRLVDAGFVRFGERWFTPDGLRAYLRALAETSVLREEIERKRAERQAAELAVRVEEERLAKAEAERRTAEEALARAEEERNERERLRAENEELRDLLRRLANRGAWGWGGYWSSGPPYVGVPYYPHGIGLPARGFRMRVR